MALPLNSALQQQRRNGDMAKHIFKWKPVRLMDVDGQEYFDDVLPRLMSSYYRGELVDQILRMEKKVPLLFHTALNLASDAQHAAAELGRSGHEPHQSYWHFSHFLDFISDQGFHIELNGDEFESPAFSSN